MAISANEARKNLLPLIAHVSANQTAVQITSRQGDAVLIARDEYDALQETAHLLRAPKSARRLLASMDQAQSRERDNPELRQ